MRGKIKLNCGSELPLKKDQANLFLEIMTTVMVFLFSVTLAGYYFINSMAESWQNGISGSLTVQIAPSAETLTEQEQNLRINKVITFFENQPSVDNVALLSQRQKQQLLQPWLGDKINLETLPVPELLDVRLQEGKVFDYEQTAAALADLAPYASIDNHNVWLHRLLQLASAVQTIGVSVLLMVSAVGALSIFYATCTSLGIHGNIIEILHIMGAKDDYIARQYARRGFWIGLFSGLAGTFFALTAFWWLRQSALTFESGLMSNAVIATDEWLMLLSLPLWTALLTMATSYWAVRRTLRKIM